MSVQKMRRIAKIFAEGDGANNNSGVPTRANWQGLGNLIASNNVFAVCNITANSGNPARPRVITAQDFGFFFNDRNTAIRGVEAEWRDMVRNTNNTSSNVPNIPSTALRLIHPTSNWMNHAGIRPTQSGSVAGIYTPSNVLSVTVASTELIHYLCQPLNNVTITGTLPPGIEKIGNTYYLKWGIGKITADQVMSANFGVQVDYAKNSGTNAGRINADYIALSVYYETPKYSLTVAQTSNVLKNENFTATITLKNTNNANNGVAVPVTVVLPAGTEFVSSNNKDYSEKDRYNNRWNAALSGPNGSTTLTITLRATTTGVKQVKATEVYTGTNNTGTTTAIEETYTIKSNLQGDINLVRGEDFAYTITIDTNQDLIKNKTVNIPLNEGVLLRRIQNINGTYDSRTGIWNATFVNRKATLTLNLTAISPGDFTQQVTLGTNVFLQNFTIIGQEVTRCNYSIIEPPESFFRFLEDGELYNLSTICTVKDTYLNSIYNGVKNNKIGVLIGENEVLGTRCSSVNSLQEIYVEFTYNKDLPLRIIIYGQYLELDLTNSMLFGAWQLKQGPYSESEYENPVILFDNLESLIENVDYTSTTIPTRRSTAKYNFKDINFAGLESDENLIKRGIAISFDYEIESELIVESQLHSDRSTNRRSVILNPNNNFCIIGDLTEKWGLKSHEINLNRFSFDLKFINSTIQNQDVSIKNVCLILFYEKDITEGALGFTLEGEHCRDYGIFMLKDLDDWGGANNKIDRLNLKGSDGELGTGSNIEAKTINVPFEVEGDTVEEAELLFQKAVQWITKDTNKGIIPSKQELIFDSAKNISYMVIPEGGFKKKYNIATIESTANFLILDGVGFSRETKVTGPVGVNNGLRNVYPVLQVVCLGGPVKIVESVDKQEMTLSGNWENGRILTIDCYKRTIFDNLGNNHTNKATLSWGWFGLLGEYDFSSLSENCIVEKVIFKEGIG